MSVELDLLRSSELFSTLTPEELTRVSGQAEMLSFPADQVLFDYGNACGMLPLVLDGSIRVFKRSESGREISLYRVTRDQMCIVTLGCLLAGDRYPATGVTEERVTAISVPGALFQQLIVSQQGFREYVFHQFAERITDLMQLVDQVAFQKLDQRLAQLLHRRGPLVHESHQQLADELGSVREIVSRILKQFEERGWIALARKRIEVVDPAALQTYSAGTQ